ncbi:MAG: prolyl oligopeptidase family serine peptidase [Carboxylicivirga sp.]|jgi:oligopeptidase B|nr:prolyl oligopeptidase family serine peptidase [Carboxylicivirga sp.]
MEGNIYIDTKSMAFVRIAYKVEDKGEVYTINMLDYQMIGNKWYLRTIDKEFSTLLRSPRTSQPFDLYQVHKQLIVNSTDTLCCRPLQSNKTIPNTEHYSLYLGTHSYNPDFWSHYQNIPITAEEKKIIADICKDKPREEQFRLAQRYDSTRTLPMAAEIQYTDTLYGHLKDDPYHWMCHKGSDSVVDYLVQQNLFANNYAYLFKKTSIKFGQQLDQWEQSGDSSWKLEKGAYFYQEKYTAMDDYPCIYKQSIHEPDSLKLIADINQLSKNYETLYFDSFEPSPSGNKLAVSIDTTGSEKSQILFKDLRLNTWMSDPISNAYFVGWSTDESTVYYIKITNTLSLNHIYSHRLGTAADKDLLIYHEKRNNYDLSASVSRNNKYLFINTIGYTNAALQILNLETGDIRKVIPLKDNLLIGSQYIINDTLYVHVEDECQNAILSMPLQGNELNTDTLYQSHNNYIDDFYLKNHQLITIEAYDGHYHLKHTNLLKKQTKLIANGTNANSYYMTSIDSTGRLLTYYSHNPVDGTEKYTYDLQKDRVKDVKNTQTPKTYRANNYCVQTIYATADDGQQIPITLYGRKSTFNAVRKDNQTVPLLMEAYGCYGIVNMPKRNPVKVALADKGWLIATAHVRGSRIKGCTWFVDGNMQQKHNTYRDAVACGEALIKQGYTSSSQMAFHGYSAGGVIGGYLINRRPELFRVVLMDVPVTDVLQNVSDKSVLGLGHRDIYGDPNNAAIYEDIVDYSPMETISPQSYPSVLITCGYNDYKVEYWQPAKYVAYLQKYNKGNNPVLLKTYLNAGHGLPPGRSKAKYEQAFQMGFLLHEIASK